MHINFKTEVTAGFEPAIDGFADRCLRPLSHVTIFPTIQWGVV